ncbi:hypothetical protein OGATHE_003656 [Ogataea polymorpha]|uniref:Uncharacterized protein n=1 Tax=Ogataea polymorpha TaxID=460523 RepID=A0A9P8P4E4_9ASCO|nr:hypothetical protein OGATHE_003656 [Ogataea polymorpha]
MLLALVRSLNDDSSGNVVDVGVNEARHEEFGFRVGNVDETHFVQLQPGEFQSVGGVVCAILLHENYSPVLVNSNGTVRKHLQSTERRGLDKRPKIAGEFYWFKAARGHHWGKLMLGHVHVDNCFALI